ncbi:MAG: SpoIID/LytB domain-containing protein [Phycisphaerae bacterium]|nr:SpoIID/LytB domain-containing protein [Phycisphaerae bacterium]
MFHRVTAAASASRLRYLAGPAALVWLCVWLTGCRPEPSVEIPGEASLAGPYIRVKIGEDTPSRLVNVLDRYQMYDRLSGKMLGQGEELAGASFSVKGGKLFLNEQPLDSGHVVIVPAHVEEARIVFPAPSPTARQPVFRGTLRVSADSDKVSLVNVLPLEQYLVSVVGKELLGKWHIETHKAQAIAARTFALYHMKNVPSGRSFDVYDSSGRSQAYQEGAASETEKAREAVRQTQGVVLTYDGGSGPRLFETFYHSTSGGQAVAAYQLFPKAPRIPPLMGVACSYSSDAPNYRWEIRQDAEQLLKNLRATNKVMEAARGVKAIAVAESGDRARTEDGRVRWVNLWTSESPDRLWEIPVSVFKKQFPPETPFRSDRFDVRLEDGVAVVSGRGYGHGIGMSQYGAEKQASLGRRAEGILYYYYPGSKLIRVY